MYGELAGVLLVVHDGAVLLLCDAHTAAVIVVEGVQLVGVLCENLVVGGHELHCAGEGERVRGGGSGGRWRRGGGRRASGGRVGVHLRKKDISSIQREHQRFNHGGSRVQDAAGYVSVRCVYPDRSLLGVRMAVSCAVVGERRDEWHAISKHTRSLTH